MSNDKISILDFVWSVRTGGDMQTERHFCDLVVDGVALSRVTGGDLVTSFGWGVLQSQLDAMERLRACAPPDLPDGCTALYVCAECGDLVCGAVGMIVERNERGVVWRNFARWDHHDDEFHSHEYTHIGPFRFEEHAYRATLARLEEEIRRADRPS